MQKRKLIIGAYDTALEGLWTLSSWTFGAAVVQENYVSVPGHSGYLDLSTALTDGEPYYGSREFEAVLESSEGTRMERETRINNMINKLDGWRVNITLPDDPDHYISGRVRVERLYNNPVHASVKITATCDPWRYNNHETVVGLIPTSTEQSTALINNGRLSVVPIIKVLSGAVTLKFSKDTETKTRTLTMGEYIDEDLYIKTGAIALTYSGSGEVTLTYREAVL